MALALLPLLAGGVWLLTLREPRALPAQPVHASSVATSSATPPAGQKAEADDYLGVIVAGYTAEVGTEVGGSVEDVSVLVGTRVKEGEPLLRVAPGVAGDGLRAARAKLEQQRSAVKRAEAELAEAGDLLTRLQSIQAGVSERQLVAARTREQQARAALEQAKAGIGVTEADLGQELTRSGKHTIRAPFDGVVVARFVDPGALVMPGQVVARVITEDYYVRYALPPEVARAQRVGASVSVELAGASAPLRAQVSDVQPEVDSAAQLVFARARLTLAPADSASVIPGMRVRVHVEPPPGGD